jgi:hypothetical protein
VSRLIAIAVSVVLVAWLVAVGCGDADPTAHMTGNEHHAYRVAQAVCRKMGPRSVARIYGGAPNPEAASRAFGTSGLGGGHPEAEREGCLAGFEE